MLDERYVNSSHVITLSEIKPLMIERCQISSSQEEILCHYSFVEPDDGAPLSSGGIPVASTGIEIASLPETAQDTAKDRVSQDVFHTPPEQQSSQSASEGHGRAIHKAVETDDEIQGFFDFSEHAEAAEYVDLRDDSELGFPQGILNQGTELTLVAECLDGNDFVGTLGEKNSGSCENLGGRPVTQWKIAKSATQCVENIESKEGNYEAKNGTDEGNKTVNEIVETFERQKGVDEQPESSVFPSSAGDILKNVAKIKKEIENGNNFVFDVFKALRKENSVEDSSLENVSWLQLANSRGFNFPRPCWWKENDNEKN